MTNGYNGTGLSCVYYLILALFMPFALFFKLTNQGLNLYNKKFILKHFTIGSMIAISVFTTTSFIWNLVGLNSQDNIHKTIIIASIASLLILLVWMLAPKIVRLAIKFFGDLENLDYRNPLIHPWYSVKYEIGSQSNPRILNIDGILPSHKKR